ncbi:MAG: LysE family translocator [Salibacteraceae bacterium]
MDNATITLFVSVIGIHLLAVMSPGPDFIMLIRNAITYSRKTGIWTAVGFGLGIGVHVLYSVFGLGFIISKTPLLYDIIKYLGAAYLAYIGIMSLKSTGSHIEVDETHHKEDISALKALRIGFLTNVLNPKATLFFLSLFTLVVGPNVPIQTLMSLGLILMVNTTLWFCLLAYLVTHSKILPTFEKYQVVFDRVFGVLLLGIAVKVAFFT